jgi:hypothetical protein
MADLPGMQPAIQSPRQRSAPRKKILQPTMQNDREQLDTFAVNGGMMKFKKVCENCGKKFETPSFWARFCSTLCRVQWHRKHK